MSFINSIFSIVWEISDWFLEAYLTVSGWWSPFSLLAEPLLAIHYLLKDLLPGITSFNEWAGGVFDALKGILSWDNIRSLILGWIPDLETIGEWFSSIRQNVTSIINDWWSATRSVVTGWIDIATEGLSALMVAWSDFWSSTWPEWTNSLIALKAAWDSFWTDTYPNLVSSSGLTTWWVSRVRDVQGLIDVSFTLRESWWLGWQDWRESVAEFFSDPVEFVWQKFTVWFLGPEE